MPSPTPEEGKLLSEFPEANLDDLTLKGWGEDSGGTKILNVRALLNSFIGMTTFFPIELANIDANWIPMDGRTVLRINYPNLAEKIDGIDGFTVSLAEITVPDLRGYYLSYASDSRAVGNKQEDAMQNMTGYFLFQDNNSDEVRVRTGGAGGVFYTSSNVSSPKMNSDGTPTATSEDYIVNMDASKMVRTATVTRPKNVNMICCIRGR